MSRRISLKEEFFSDFSTLSIKMLFESFEEFSMMLFIDVFYRQRKNAINLHQIKKKKM